MRRVTCRAAALLLAALVCFASTVTADGSETATGEIKPSTPISSASPSPEPTSTPPPSPASTSAATPTEGAAPTSAPSAHPGESLKPSGTPDGEPAREPNPEPSPEPTPGTLPEISDGLSSTETPYLVSTPEPDATLIQDFKQTMPPAHDPTAEPGASPTLTPEPTPSPAPDEQSDGTGLKLTREKPRLDWTGVVPSDDGGMPIPRLYQYNYKTVLLEYDGIPRSVMTSGCNVTSVAMVAAYLTGEEHSPEKLFSWALEKNLYHGDGLSHSAMSKVAANYGVSGKWIGRDGDAVIEALKAGKPVIAHMGPGLFTSRGHYIVLRGVTEDGKILVNDPSSAKRSKLAYPLKSILREARTSAPFMVCDELQGYE